MRDKLLAGIIGGVVGAVLLLVAIQGVHNPKIPGFKQAVAADEKPLQEPSAEAARHWAESPYTPTKGEMAALKFTAQMSSAPAASDYVRLTSSLARYHTKAGFSMGVGLARRQGATEFDSLPEDVRNEELRALANIEIQALWRQCRFIDETTSPAQNSIRLITQIDFYWEDNAGQPRFAVYNGFTDELTFVSSKTTPDSYKESWLLNLAGSPGGYGVPPLQ